MGGRGRGGGGGEMKRAVSETIVRIPNLGRLFSAKGSDLFTPEWSGVFIHEGAENLAASQKFGLDEVMQKGTSTWIPLPKPCTRTGSEIGVER